jgi:hypothetical protein
VSRILDDFAKAIHNPDLPAWLPRDSKLDLHLGRLASVDLGRQAVSYQWTHPSGEITHGIPFVQGYSRADPPRKDDVVQLMQFGALAVILGKVTRGTVGQTIVVP